MMRQQQQQGSWLNVAKYLIIFFFVLFLLNNLYYHLFPSSFIGADEAEEVITIPPPQLTAAPRVTAASRSNRGSAPKADAAIPLDSPSLGIDFNWLIDDEHDLLIQAQKIDEETRIENLYNWLKRAGARMQGWDYKQIAPEYRGVFAAEDLPTEYEFMFIPKICMLNAHHFNNTVLSRVILEAKGEDWYAGEYATMLAWFLLTERFNPTSFFKHYISLLPLKYKTLPQFWTDKEFEHLKGSHAIERIKNDLVYAKDEYLGYLDLIPALKVFTFENFLWARTAVSSRVWAGNGDENMLPMLDMLNHMQPTIYIRHDWTDEGTSFTTILPHKKGQQLYFHYGNKGQTDFLQFYGFTVPENELENTVPCLVSLSKDDPLKNKKETFLGGAEMKCDLLFQYTMEVGPYYNTPNCYGFIRVAAADSESSYKHLSQPVGPISFTNEVKAWSILSKSASNQLKSYPQTFQEDKDILDSTPDLISTNFNYYCAIIVRMAEKELFHYVIDVADLLKNLEDHLLSNIDNKSDKKIIQKYVTEWTISKLKKEKNRFTKHYFIQVLPELFSIDKNVLNQTLTE